VAVRRIDSAVRLDGVKRTPQGGIRVDAALARPGILKYRQPDGQWISEYLPPSEAFKADSLETLAAAPITKLHPPEMVTRRNWSKYARGTVGDNVRQDDGKVVATVYLQDADLADAVERGDMREMSCGYVCDLLNTPGVVPAGEPDAGQRYDRMQINRRYNHAAVVPMGRAGAEIALRLDASDNVITDEEVDMKIEKIDGVEYEIGTDAHRAAEGRRDAKAKEDKAASDKLQARADKAEADLIAERKDRDGDKARADKAEAELSKFRKDASDKARASLEGSSRKVLGAEFKFDAADGKPMSDAEIRRAVAIKANPEMKLDGKSDAYVEVLFDMAVAKFDEAGAALGALNATVIDGSRTDAASKGAGAINWEQKRADMVARLNGETKAKE
jgi:hypothetical protein